MWTGHMGFVEGVCLVRASFGARTEFLDADFLGRSLLLEPNIRNSLQYAFGSFFARTGALAENGV